MADQSQHKSRIHPPGRLALDEAALDQALDQLLEDQGRLFVLQQQLPETAQPAGMKERLADFPAHGEGPAHVPV